VTLLVNSRDVHRSSGSAELAVQRIQPGISGAEVHLAVADHFEESGFHTDLEKGMGSFTRQDTDWGWRFTNFRISANEGESWKKVM